MKYTKGFTLAEVLITLGIIGVVAALTLPALIQNYRKSVVENKLKAEYSLISNAVRMAEAKNGASEDWDTCSQDSDEEYTVCAKSFFDNYLLPELKIVKLCSKENLQECWTPPYSLTGRKGYLSDSDILMPITLILSNGSSLYMWLGAQKSESAHLQIWFDIDGPTKGRNTLGVDVFGTVLFFKPHGINTRSGLVMNGNSVGYDANILKGHPLYACSKSLNTAYAGIYCGALIQQNGWKIPKDYPVRL